MENPQQFRQLLNNYVLEKEKQSTISKYQTNRVQMKALLVTQVKTAKVDENLD